MANHFVHLVGVKRQERNINMAKAAGNTKEGIYIYIYICIHIYIFFIRDSVKRVKKYSSSYNDRNCERRLVDDHVYCECI